MKRNKSGGLSVKELDQLMNQAFLNLDFEYIIFYRISKTLVTS